MIPHLLFLTFNFWLIQNNFVPLHQENNKLKLNKIMAEFENNLNIIEKANKVLTFRKYIREECRKNGLEYPSDEKVSEWIDQNYGWSVEDFMKDYTEKEGIFRDPFNDFKDAVLKYDWATPPTDEEMRSYVAENGYNVKGFLRYHTINGYSPLEKEILIATLKLKTPKLIDLWNIFIEESSLYGDDSYIYNLDSATDMMYLKTHMKSEDLKRVKAISNTGVRYLQWFSMNDGKINGRSDEDVKSTIVAYWGEIFDRIMLYPYAYQFKIEKSVEGYGSTYFDDVFFPIIAEKVGYKIDGDKGTIAKI